MLAAPLIAGNDITKMSAATKKILTNKEVIAIDQDKAGIQGFVYKVKDSIEIWVKPLSEDNWTVCFLNRSLEPKDIDFNWHDELIYDTLLNRTLDARKINYQLCDLWKKSNTGDTRELLKSTIPAHDVLMFKLSQK